MTDTVVGDGDAGPVWWEIFGRAGGAVLENTMPGRSLNIEWRESADDLYRRYEQERNGHRKVRLQAFWLLRRGYQIGEVGKEVQVDYRTIQRWISWYRVGGIEAVIQRTPGHGAPGRPSRLKPEQVQSLVQKASRGEFRTVWDAVDWVEHQFGVTYTYTGMHALLSRNAVDA
ncbi:MAG: helix-turn-helix domain-containing protein [Thermomicrobiales bacterium]